MVRISSCDTWDYANELPYIFNFERYKLLNISELKICIESMHSHLKFLTGGVRKDRVTPAFRVAFSPARPQDILAGNSRSQRKSLWISSRFYYKRKFMDAINLNSTYSIAQTQ